MSETRARFLREIADRLGGDQVHEVHLFTPIKQGGVESGVAVVAVRLEPPATDAPEPPDDSWLTTDAPLQRGVDLPDDAASVAPPAAPPRLTIHSAHYRLQLKGADRGKWDFDISAEADAPLAAVDDVVRGVVRRAGEAMEPERLSGDAFRAALHEEPWTAAR
jgi:hypothetical protein